MRKRGIIDNSENLIMPMDEATWWDFFGMKVKERSWKERK